MKLCFVTTCKGRLSHLKVMSSRLMADARVGKEWGWVLVDFDCPDKSGEWAKETYGDRVDVLDVRLEDVPFNKPLALNSGAMRAIELGAEYLAFVDADTLLNEEFLNLVESHLTFDRFLIVEPSMEKRDLTGFVVVNWRHYLRVGGYDIEFKGWGAEDLDFRLRLFLRGGLKYVELPALADSIQHSDEGRTQHYEQKDKHESHELNLNRLCANVVSWTGEHLLQHYEDPKKGAELRRLLGVESVSPRRILL